MVRAGLQAMLAGGAEVNLAVEVIYNLSLLEQPPLHLPLGKDAVDVIRKQLPAIGADVDKYES